MGLTDLFFFENYCLAERVSRSLLGAAEPEGSPAKLAQFFRFWERAARATGQGRGRDSRQAGPRSITRRASRTAPRPAARGRRENDPPVEKNTILLYYTRPPFGEWGVPLVVTQAGMPQIKVDVTSECEFLILTVSKNGDISK